MRNASHFNGLGAYTCRTCGHLTRATGRGDNDNIELCAPCYDLGGEENSLSDNGQFYASPENVLALIAAVKGNASCWDELKEHALLTVTK